MRYLPNRFSINTILKCAPLLQQIDEKRDRADQPLPETADFFSDIFIQVIIVTIT